MFLWRGQIYEIDNLVNSFFFMINRKKHDDVISTFGDKVKYLYETLHNFFIKPG